MSIEKLNEILIDLKKGIDELSSRSVSVATNTSAIIDSTTDDVNVIPKYLLTVQNTINELKKTNTSLVEKIMLSKESIETVTTEIEINESKKDELLDTETKKRAYKEELERKIVELQHKKSQLETQLTEEGALAVRKEQEYTQLEISSKEQINRLNEQINEATLKLKQAEAENKLIVYLMDAGLMDVPEAEVVSIIASYPNGLKLDEIKQKVNMPPVRVQPTINNLLETVLEYDALTDSYRIMDIIKKELI